MVDRNFIAPGRGQWPRVESIVFRPVRLHYRENILRYQVSTRRPTESFPNPYPTAIWRAGGHLSPSYMALLFYNTGKN